MFACFQKTRLDKILHPGKADEPLLLLVKQNPAKSVNRLRFSFPLTKLQFNWFYHPKTFSLNEY
jgi:hypothetical protein